MRVAELPEASARTCAVRSVLLVIGTPLNTVMTSFGWMPAAAAAPPELTEATIAPTVELSLLVASLTDAPSSPWVAVPLAMISFEMRSARFAGIAKPTPIDPDWLVELVLPVLAIATLVGTLVALLQAATQIQEQTLTLLPKIIAVSIALIVFGNFGLQLCAALFNEAVARLPAIVHAP